MSEKKDSLPFKISTLIFAHDTQGRQLLIRRNKEPNKFCWSPIGGKLEMTVGESPFQCAIREVREEISLDVSESDLHMFAMISEKSYEGNAHWLMFLFECKKALNELPPIISEGELKFFRRSEISKLKIPETDRKMIWNSWDRFHSGGFVVLRADCHPDGELSYMIEQITS